MSIKCIWVDFPGSPQKCQKHVSAAFLNVKNVFKMSLKCPWDMFWHFFHILCWMGLRNVKKMSKKCPRDIFYRHFKDIFYILKCCGDIFLTFLRRPWKIDPNTFIWHFKWFLNFLDFSRLLTLWIYILIGIYFEIR